jgi:hypothetical protein
MLVIKVVTPCSFVGRHQRFEGTYCLHIQRYFRVKRYLFIYLFIYLFDDAFSGT